jgi:hypothetical protein
MARKSRVTRRALNATYRRFGNIAQFNGREILWMDDIDIDFEHDLQKTIKVRVWEFNLLDIELNELRLKAHTLGIGRNLYRIISFQYHGNDQEELILILEGKGTYK